MNWYILFNDYKESVNLKKYDTMKTQATDDF